MASPVFKTAWTGVSRSEGSTPFLLRQSKEIGILRWQPAWALLRSGKFANTPKGPSTFYRSRQRGSQHRWRSQRTKGTREARW